MKLSLTTQWQLGQSKDETIEPALFSLLAEIAHKPSLRHAARVKHISYRHAWGLIKKWESIFQKPLLNMKRGRNADSELSEFAQQLLHEHEQVAKRLKPILEQESDYLSTFLKSHIQTKQKTVQLRASHDLVIQELFDLLEQSHPGLLELKTQGSIKNLKSLSNEQCDIAGFHFPIADNYSSIEKEYRPLLENRTFKFIHLVKRSQGLMVNKDNPKKIHNLQDIAKRSVRYINRQSGSGTRSLFDKLLAEANIDAEAIKGYKHEEFTHDAVAAMIVSGAADVGMGIHASAKQFGLKFIPLVEERYVLALSPTLDTNVKKILVKQLKNASFKKFVNKLPGYDTSAMGNELKLEGLFE